MTKFGHVTVHLVVISAAVETVRDTLQTTTRFVLVLVAPVRRLSVLERLHHISRQRAQLLDPLTLDGILGHSPGVPDPLLQPPQLCRCMMNAPLHRLPQLRQALALPVIVQLTPGRCGSRS